MVDPGCCLSFPTLTLVSSISRQPQGEEAVGLRLQEGLLLLLLFFTPLVSNGDGPFPRSTFPCLRSQAWSRAVTPEDSAVFAVRKRSPRQPAGRLHPGQGWRTRKSVGLPAALTRGEGWLRRASSGGVGEAGAGRGGCGGLDREEAGSACRPPSQVDSGTGQDVIWWLVLLGRCRSSGGWVVGGLCSLTRHVHLGKERGCGRAPGLRRAAHLRPLRSSMPLQTHLGAVAHHGDGGQEHGLWSQASRVQI